MKNKTILLIILSLAMSLTLLYGIDYFPRTITAFYVVSDSEEINNRAIDGIETITSQYNTDILLPLKFYHSSVNQEYSTEAIDEFLGEFPYLEPGTMIVNKRRISNHALPIETGKPYNYLVQREYYRASPLQISASKVIDNGQLSTEIDITLISETETIVNGRLVVVIVEDNVTDSITNLARDVKTFEVSLTEQGESVLKETDFDLDGSWDTDNLRIVAFVETEDGENVQSASTYVNATPHLRAAFPHPRTDIGPSSGLFEAEYFSVFAFGSDLEITVNAEIDDAPEMWELTWCDDEGSCYFGPFDFHASEGQGIKFHSNVVPEGPGMMDYHFTISSPAFLVPYKIPQRYISDDVDIIVIDGDGWQDYEEYTTAALDETDYTYGIWSITMDDIIDGIDMEKMVWVSGEREPALESDEIRFLRSYINNGNSLFISGQNIGEYLIENKYYQDAQFYQMYLNAVLEDIDSQSLDLMGIDGDPVSEGLSFSLNGGDSADNQINPSKIRVAHTDRGTEIIRYDDDSYGAIRTLNPLQRGSVVYMAFGFEGIDDAGMRTTLLQNSLEWHVTTDVEEDLTNPEIETNLRLKQSFPNPFSISQPTHRSNTILISYYLPANSQQVSLGIYNIKGQLVRQYSELPVFEDGYGYIEWNGRDKAGDTVATGIYLYKLTDGQNEDIKKLSIIR